LASEGAPGILDKEMVNQIGGLLLQLVDENLDLPKTLNNVKPARSKADLGTYVSFSAHMNHPEDLYDSRYRT
jgi:hypothetical protein